MNFQAPMFRRMMNFSTISSVADREETRGLHVGNLLLLLRTGRGREPGDPHWDWSWEERPAETKGGGRSSSDPPRADRSVSCGKGHVSKNYPWRQFRTEICCALYCTWGRAFDEIIETSEFILLSISSHHQKHEF